MIFSVVRILFILLLFSLPKRAHANLIFEDPEFAKAFVQGAIVFGVLILILLGVINAFIEFGVIYLILRKRVMNKTKLLKPIFLINFITFPLTQLWAFFLLNSSNDRSIMVYSAELVPLFLEYPLLKWQFNRLYANGFLTERLNNKSILTITIFANLTSFLFGILMLNAL